MDWGRTILEAQPARCLPIVFIDGNARMGENTVNNHLGLQLLGDQRPEKETCNSHLLREFAIKTNLQLINTAHCERSGVTWSGGKGYCSRI